MDDFRQMIDVGELTSDDTISLARAAAEAIRGLNRPPPRAGLGQPSAAYDILGALSLAAARIGQALAQITRYLDRALAAGHLGHDHGQDPAHAASRPPPSSCPTRPPAPPPWPATWTPPSSNSPPSTAAPETATS